MFNNCFFVYLLKLALSIHSKHKRTQNKQRKQKSLLGNLKPNIISTNIVVVASSTPIIEQLPSTEIIINNISPPNLPPPGSDRKTRGFRVHIEPRTHTVTRTNRKQKITIKQEPIEIKPIIKEEPSSSLIPITIKGWFLMSISEINGRGYFQNNF